MLRTTQPFRLLRRIEEGLGAVGPDQAAAGGLEDRPFVDGADIEQAGLALDHDVPGVGGGGGDQGDALTALLDLGADPFGAGAGLAETAAGEDQPVAPGSWGRLLRGAALVSPVAAEKLLGDRAFFFRSLLNQSALRRRE